MTVDASWGKLPPSRPDIGLVATSKVHQVAKRKRSKKVPREVIIDMAAPPTESEVTLGGEQYSVRIRSTAPLGQVVSYCEDLYRQGLSAQARRPPMGFAGPGVGAAEISGPVEPHLLALDAD